MKHICLNGYWDFLPVFDPVDEAARVPDDGFSEASYLVPSVWTKAPERPVRIDGEEYPYRNDGRFAWDDFRYPEEWNRTRSAWMKRSIDIESADIEASRVLLEIGAVMPKAALYVNGARVGAHIHPTLPWTVDVTDALHVGRNEIAVLVTDYTRDEAGRATVPTGNNIITEHCGIWQDVFLRVVSPVRVADVTIRTSVRRSTITVIVEVVNDTDETVSVAVDADCAAWARDADPYDAEPLLELSSTNRIAGATAVPSHATASVTIEKAWTDPRLWSPEDPFLYALRVSLSDSAGGADLDRRWERFGFREVWIEGRDILLNGTPIRLFSDWGHKLNLHSYTDGWIRAWFAMLRDANMNHSRLHTHPHPPIFMDLADEEGILLTGEAGLHGSGGAQAATSPAFWEAAADHVRRFVARDKNHPSLILWSVENEMRWNNKADPSELVFVRRELPKLRGVFGEADPTRVAYHEGDSSLWNEAEQPIVTRHYGKECAGAGWWDGEKPLHSGEMCLYHYSGPNNTLHIGGDRVYASWKALDVAAGRDLEYIVEEGRARGVCCFGPWNLSCNENLRPEREAKRLSYDDLTAPGIKPLYAEPHTSELSYWAEEPYRKNFAFDIQRRAFRPFAVIDTSRRTGYFAGSEVHRTIHLVNDSHAPQSGRLVALVTRDGADISAHQSQLVSVPRGGRMSIEVTLRFPNSIDPGPAAYLVRFENDGGEVDAFRRTVYIGDLEAVSPSGISVALYGTEEEAALIQSLGYTVVRTEDSRELPSAAVMVVGEEAVKPGSSLPTTLRRAVANKIPVVVLRQTVSPFAGLPLSTKPVLTAFIRGYGHPVFDGIVEEELHYWGDSSYAELANDGYVAEQMYVKDDAIHPLLDSGEGGFGSGSLRYTPLFQMPGADSAVLACQLRLVEKAGSIPAARRLLGNLIAYACGPISAQEARDEGRRAPGVFDGLDASEVSAAAEAAKRGATVLVEGLTVESAMVLQNALGADGPSMDLVDAPRTFQLVRTGDHPLLSGISNEDLCGIEEFSYYHGDHPSVEVIRRAVRPDPKIDALAVTPTESCLKELFVDGGKGERTRANTITRFLLHAKRDALVGIGRISVGAGTLVFSQFSAPAELRDRFRRVRHALRSNVAGAVPPGVDRGGIFHDGPVPEPRANGKGYPDHVFALTREVSGRERKEMVESTRPSSERMMTFPILNIPGWARVPTDEGSVTADELTASAPDQKAEQDGGAADIYLYYFITSPSPRKNVLSDDAVPNPQALTFLDAYGEGNLELFINGRRAGELELSASGTTFGDLELEMGYNHVLCRWRGDSPAARIRFQWRDIMRRAETEFVFKETVND